MAQVFLRLDRVLLGSGAKKLGQPEPESNFVSERKSSAPQAPQRKMPSSWTRFSSPDHGASVAPHRSTW